MTPEVWSQDVVRARLEALPRNHRTAFAAACAERLLPNYAAFVRKEGWGSVSLLRGALTAVWRALEGKPFSKERIESLIQEVKQQIPDTEDFTSTYVSPALDAGAAVVHTLESLADGGVEPALLAASLAHDTVHMHLQSLVGSDYADPSFDERMYGQPLMMREMERQSRDLDLLSKAVSLTPEFLSEFRMESEGKSNIDALSLVDR